MQASSSRSEADIRMTILYWIQLNILQDVDMVDNVSKLEDFDESLLVELRSVKDFFSLVIGVIAERKIPMLLMLLLMLDL